ncbi:MAG: hypothetical protein KJ734_00165, partial [Chloroflexi bacterium]|nr:hypothetical protein [Chloroflexota bacterium]
MSHHIRELEVTSLGELLQAVTPVAPDPQSGRLRDSAVYRGSVNAKWHLLTSLDRLGMPAGPSHAKGHLETYL